MVGRSGRTSERRAVVTASALTFPALTCGPAVGADANISCTSPDSIAVIAGAPPLYGTCTIFVLVMLQNNSAARCPAFPLPVDPYVSTPGCLRAYAIRSCTLLIGRLGCTTSTLLPDTAKVTGAR